jgi:hypothetical protein
VTDVRVGGYAGKRLTVTIPTEPFEPLPSATPDPDPAHAVGCDEQAYRIWNAEGFDIYAQGPTSRWHISILDVEGRRIVLLAFDYPGTPAEDRAELQAIIDSIRIEP